MFLCVSFVSRRFCVCVLFLLVFLLKLTNSNGDQIRQEFPSVKVVSSKLWHDTEVAAECALVLMHCVNAHIALHSV